MRHFFVIYDSVFNSVFLSQVVNRAHRLPNPVLISFERDVQKAREWYLRSNISLPLIILKRGPFLTHHLMFFEIQKLKKIFAGELGSYAVVARGPLAGHVALKALTKNCKTLTIQARGLLAAEYEYAHKQITSGIRAFFMRWALVRYQVLEKRIYGDALRNESRILIEAVSPALRRYVIKNYQAPAFRVVVAADDIPALIDKVTRSEWRHKTRTQLGIPLTDTVYCYNGSAHSWQLPHETINFFKTVAHLNSATFFLVLSQEPDLFKILLQHSGIASHRWTVCSVKHSEVAQFLAAADYGIVLRESHSVNWVSRPTKALEYMAVGVSVIHNNTVAALAHHPQTFMLWPHRRCAQKLLMITHPD